MAATATMTPARLRALAVFTTVACLAFGVLGGQAARRSALLSLRDVVWTADTVEVTYRDGSTVLALVALAAGMAVIGALCWWGGRFAARRTFADPAGARRWAQVAAAVWGVALAGAVGGWVATSSADAIAAERVASFLAGHGDEVGVEITAGEQEVVRPTGLRDTVLEAPVVLEYTADGQACTVVVDDPLAADGTTITLTPACRQP